MRITFMEPYCPDSVISKTTKSSRTLTAGNSSVGNPAVAQRVATNRISFEFAPETHLFSKESYREKNVLEPNISRFIREGSCEPATTKISTVHSDTISGPDPRACLPTCNGPLNRRRLVDEYMTGQRTLEAAEKPMTGVGVVGGEHDAQHLPSTTEIELPAYDPVPLESKSSGIGYENSQRGEEFDKVTTGTAGCMSSSISSVSDDPKTESNSHLTAPHSVGSANRSSPPTERGIEQDGAAESRAIDSDPAEVSTIGVELNEDDDMTFLDGEVESIIGEETIRDKLYYLVRWEPSQVHADDAKGMQDLIQEWEMRQARTAGEQGPNVAQDSTAVHYATDHGVEEVPSIGTVPKRDQDQSPPEWEVKRIIEEETDGNDRYYLVDWKETLVDADQLRHMGHVIGMWEHKKVAIKRKEERENRHRRRRDSGDFTMYTEGGRAEAKRQRKS